MSEEIRTKWRDLIGEFILEFDETELDVFRIFEDFGSEADIANVKSKLFKQRAIDAITLIDRAVENVESRTRSVRALNELIKLADNVRNLVAHNPLQMTLEGGRDKGRFSVWVNGNWRVTFRFEGVDATDVDYEDYH